MKFSNQRSARLERVFVRVPKGTGNYIYLGDLNNNGIADEDEFQKVLYDGDYTATYIQSDTLYPVSSLKASTRWRFTPSRIMGKPSTAFEKMLQAITTETYLRVDEKTAVRTASKSIFSISADFSILPPRLQGRIRFCRMYSSLKAKKTFRSVSGLMCKTD